MAVVRSSAVYRHGPSEEERIGFLRCVLNWFIKTFPESGTTCALLTVTSGGGRQQQSFHANKGPLQLLWYFLLRNGPWTSQKFPGTSVSADIGFRDGSKCNMPAQMDLFFNRVLESLSNSQDVSEQRLLQAAGGGKGRRRRTGTRGKKKTAVKRSTTKRR